MGMHELFDDSAAQELDGGWIAFDVAEPTGCEIVQQYLGKAVMEHSNPPDWAFPTERWRGKRDEAATHWRYVDAPNDELNGLPKASPLEHWVRVVEFHISGFQK